MSREGPTEALHPENSEHPAPRCPVPSAADTSSLKGSTLQGMWGERWLRGLGFKGFKGFGGLGV